MRTKNVSLKRQVGATPIRSSSSTTLSKPKPTSLFKSMSEFPTEKRPSTIQIPATKQKFSNVPLRRLHRVPTPLHTLSLKKLTEKLLERNQQQYAPVEILELIDKICEKQGVCPDYVVKAKQEIFPRLFDQAMDIRQDEDNTEAYEDLIYNLHMIATDLKQQSMIRKIKQKIGQEELTRILSIFASQDS